MYFLHSQVHCSVTQTLNKSSKSPESSYDFMEIAHCNVACQLQGIAVFSMH